MAFRGTRANTNCSRLRTIGFWHSRRLQTLLDLLVLGHNLRKMSTAGVCQTTMFSQRPEQARLWIEWWTSVSPGNQTMFQLSPAVVAATVADRCSQCLVLRAVAAKTLALHPLIPSASHLWWLKSTHCSKQCVPSMGLSKLLCSWSSSTFNWLALQRSWSWKGLAAICATRMQNSRLTCALPLIAALIFCPSPYWAAEFLWVSKAKLGSVWDDHFVGLDLVQWGDPTFGDLPEPWASAIAVRNSEVEVGLKKTAETVTWTATWCTPCLRGWSFRLLKVLPPSCCLILKCAHLETDGFAPTYTVKLWNNNFCKKEIKVNRTDTANCICAKVPFDLCCKNLADILDIARVESRWQVFSVKSLLSAGVFRRTRHIDIEYQT